MFGKIRLVVGVAALPMVLLAAMQPKDAQKRVKEDQELVAKIRKAVAKDASLPVSSKNVDVTVHNGVVTLKGRVRYDAESQAIQGKAESMAIQEQRYKHAGDAPRIRVDNELIVRPR